MRSIAMTTLSLVFAVGASILPAGAAQAAASKYPGYTNTGKICDFRSYPTTNKVKVTSQKPLLTHLKVRTLVPNERIERSTAVTTKKQVVVTASVEYGTGASVDAGIAKAILVKAGSSLNLSLAVQGTVTTSKSVKVSHAVHNKTSKNVAYVYYSGYDRHVKGTWTRRTCMPQRTGGHTWYVHKATGKFQSFAIKNKGAVQCRAGAPTRLDKEAQRLACR